LKRIAILGSTGSIGTQALDVVRRNPHKLRVEALAAGRNVEKLIAQTEEFKPAYAAINDEAGYPQLSRSCNCRTGQGKEAIASLAALEEIDLVLIAVSGAAGIWATYEAIRAGKAVALANKESLVTAGTVIMPLAAESGAMLLPVDSEHSAIFQCIQGEEKSVDKIWITASGGPFRTWNPSQLAAVTPEQALRHPKWRMGPKITVDSATLMNKGLEVIEAHHLFGLSYDRIKVVIHPQSIVHSLVEFRDGSFLGHLGVPDMRIPIQYAFSYPERWDNPAPVLDLLQMGSLDFFPPDKGGFPALELAFAAGGRGGTMPAVLNAANEVAVSHFLNNKIGFLEIAGIVEKVMGIHKVIEAPSLEEIMAADKWARAEAMGYMKG